ncbi:MAG: hypothetical protein V1822_03325, partial [Candidatus Micrarchaeota archaeon]
ARASGNYNSAYSAAINILDISQKMSGLDIAGQTELYSAAYYAASANERARAVIADNLLNLGFPRAQAEELIEKHFHPEEAQKGGPEEQSEKESKPGPSGTSLGGQTSGYWDHIPANPLILGAGTKSETKVTSPALYLPGDLTIFIGLQDQAEAQKIITELAQIKNNMDLNKGYVIDQAHLLDLCQKLDSLIDPAFWTTKRYWKGGNGAAAHDALMRGDIQEFFKLATPENPIVPLFDVPPEATYTNTQERMLAKYGLILPFDDFLRILHQSFNSSFGLAYVSAKAELWHLDKSIGFGQILPSGEVIKTPFINSSTDYAKIALGGSVVTVLPGLGGTWLRPEIMFTTRPDKNVFRGLSLTAESRDANTGIAFDKIYIGEAFGKNGSYLGNITMDYAINWSILEDKHSGFVKLNIVVPAGAVWTSLAGFYVQGGYMGQFGQQQRASSEASFGGSFITSALLGTQAWYTKILSDVSYMKYTDFAGGSQDTLSLGLFNGLLGLGSNLTLHYDNITSMRGLSPGERASVTTINVQVPPENIWKGINSFFK